MPVFANTPEALLGRSDSKNEAGTCRGITSNGRPCRRPVTDDAPPANPRPKPSRMRTDDPSDESQYCWQHKDQASAFAQSRPGRKTSHNPAPGPRSSLDTLAERLGLARTNSEKPQRPSGGGHQQAPAAARRPKPKSESLFCCCFRILLEDMAAPPRPSPHPAQPAVSTPPRPGGKKYSGQYLSPSPSPSRPDASQTALFMSLIPPDVPPQTASQLLAELAKPISPQDEPGYIYIFWLTPESQPSGPPAEAARSLLSPPSATQQRSRRPSDVLESFASFVEDDGDSDYMDDDYVPSDEDDEEPVNRGRRRNSRAKSSNGTKNNNNSGGSSSSSNKTNNKKSGNKQAKTTENNKKKKTRTKGKKTILLKIGRANNVQRRLNEWQRQCGYNLSLVRYYPYVPSSGRSPSRSPSPNPGAGAGAGAVPRKMPHSHKVERLVHIELQGRGLRVLDRDKCEACGREHREWFEVEASRSAVALVDEVVRRWSDWDEAQG